MANNEVTSEGKRMIDAWILSQEEVRRSESRLSSAKADEHSTRMALAKWMLPEDVKEGEKIAVWFGDSLIQVEYGDKRTDPVVTVRARGKHGAEMGLGYPVSAAA